MATVLRHIVTTFALGALSLGSTAFAQSSDGPSALELNTQSGVNNLDFSSTVSGAIIDLPPEALGSTLLDLDLSNPDCLTGNVGCFTRNASPARFDYAKSFSAGELIGLDFELEPRARMRFSDDESSALVGAIVRIGDDLRDGKVKKNTWYLFAGADAEAMTYSPDSVSRITSGQFGLQDRIIVGDAQAGIGYRMGDADVSLGYYRREVSSIEDNDPNNDFSLSEDAAAISFTWRR